MPSGSHQDVQLFVDQELVDDHAVVTMSGNHASALSFIDGRHRETHHLFISRVSDFGTVGVSIWGTDRDGEDHYWSVRFAKRRPCNCGKQKS